MIRGALSLAGRLRVTLGYGVLLVAVTAILVALGPDVRDDVIAHASTNLHNLRRGHVGTLLGSAFVVDAGSIAIWLPGLLCLLAVAELVWGSARLLIAFVAGHVGATLLVAAGLVAAVRGGWASADIARATDVGMSYGATAVLGALTAAIPTRLRPPWVAWWLGVAVSSVAVAQDFTGVGHALALLLGMAVAARFGAGGRWTGWRVGLLSVGCWFGFLVLANTVPEMAVAVVTGALAAAVAGLTAMALRRRSSATRTSENIHESTCFDGTRTNHRVRQ